MAQTVKAPSSGNSLLDTLFGISPFINLIILAHLAALFVWIVLLLRGSTARSKTTKQH